MEGGAIGVVDRQGARADGIAVTQTNRTSVDGERTSQDAVTCRDFEHAIVVLRQRVTYSRVGEWIGDGQRVTCGHFDRVVRLIEADGARSRESSSGTETDARGPVYV